MTLDHILREILGAYTRFMDRRKFAPVARRYEERRKALIARRDREKKAHHAYRHLEGELRENTNRALAASLGRKWP